MFMSTKIKNLFIHCRLSVRLIKVAFVIETILEQEEIINGYFFTDFHKTRLLAE